MFRATLVIRAFVCDTLSSTASSPIAIVSLVVWVCTTLVTRLTEPVTSPWATYPRGFAKRREQQWNGQKAEWTDEGVRRTGLGRSVWGKGEQRHWSTSVTPAVRFWEATSKIKALAYTYWVHTPLHISSEKLLSRPSPRCRPSPRLFLPGNPPKNCPILSRTLIRLTVKIHTPSPHPPPPRFMNHDQLILEVKATADRVCAYKASMLDLKGMTANGHDI